VNVGDVVRVDGHGGVAFRINDFEYEYSEFEGMDVYTGRVLAVMVGDDHVWRVDADDCTPLGEHEYCHDCGQTGCGWNRPTAEEGGD
jgi:hypothetical protein